MKTFKGLMLIGFVAVCGTFGLAACGDETGDSTSSSSSSSSSTTSSSTSSSSTGSSSSGAMATLCDKYCDSVTANCTDAMHIQYGSRDVCMGACAMFESLGKLGMEGEMAGDTVGCRAYHAGVAKNDDHCFHAGPFGGDVCGKTCEVFCTLATATCKTEYPDAATCATDCAGYAAMPGYYDAATGDNFACRAYHLTAAATPGGAATHCEHTSKTSSICK